MSFDPLNKTVPPGVWSTGTTKNTYAKDHMVGELASHVYDNNAQTFITCEGVPSFVPQATADVLDDPTQQLHRFARTTGPMPYMDAELIAEIQENDAKFNPFTYDDLTIDKFSRPAGPQTYSWILDKLRDDVVVTPPWENPDIVPPCEGGGGSERPETGLLYPRKV